MASAVVSRSAESSRAEVGVSPSCFQKAVFCPSFAFDARAFTAASVQLLSAPLSTAKLAMTARVYASSLPVTLSPPMTMPSISKRAK